MDLGHRGMCLRWGLTLSEPEGLWGRPFVFVIRVVKEGTALGSTGVEGKECTGVFAFCAMVMSATLTTASDRGVVGGPFGLGFGGPVGVALPLPSGAAGTSVVVSCLGAFSFLGFVPCLCRGVCGYQLGIICRGQISCLRITKLLIEGVSIGLDTFQLDE